jgi:Carboxypeptidase activation peptide.
MGIKRPKRKAGHPHSASAEFENLLDFLAWWVVHVYIYLATSNRCVISVFQLHFWVGPSRIQKAVDIMVPPHMLPLFADIVEGLDLKSEVYISNVQQ